MGREEILLKEYETCQSNNNSLESQVWTSTAIFMSFNVTLLGGLMYAVLTNRLKVSSDNIQLLVPLYVLLFFGIIAILFLWKNWIERIRVMRLINNLRMSQIEAELGMWKNRMIPVVDEHSNVDVPPAVKKDIEYIKDHYGKTIPGTDSLLHIVNTIIALWFLVFVASLVVMFM